MLSNLSLNRYMIALLNLPKPSDELLSVVTSYIDTLQINNDAKKYYDDTQSGKINCIDGQIFSCPSSIYIQMFREFYPYIKEKFNTSIGIFKNTDTNNLSYLPPHIDAIRTLGLNYIISEGGVNTLTTMYKMDSPKSTKARDIQMIPYEELDLSFSVKTIKDNWYATDIQNYHSVDNIETQRTILSISFNHINYSYFKKKYSNLIVNEWLPCLGSNQGHFD